MIRYLAHALDVALLGALVLFAALGMILSVSGCSSFLPTADRASLFANHAIAVAQTEAHDARATQLDACTDEACLDAGEAAWAPWLASIEALRQLGAAFDDALSSAGRLGDSPDVERVVIEAACDLLRAFDRTPALLAQLEAAGVHVSHIDIPPALADFMRLAHDAAPLLCPGAQ